MRGVGATQIGDGVLCGCSSGVGGVPVARDYFKNVLRGYLLWHAELNCHLGHCIPATLLPVQLPANVCVRKQKMPQVLGFLVTCVGDLADAPSTWLQLGYYRLWESQGVGGSLCFFLSVTLSLK